MVYVIIKIFKVRDDSMEEYILKDLDILQINKNGRIYYGGSQEWFFNFFKKQAGCGPTTATNLFIYLAKTDRYFEKIFSDDINYENVLKMMNQVWKDVTPGIMGVNRLAILEEGSLKYAQRFNVKIKPIQLEIIPQKNDETSVKDYLIEQITSNRPVAFLNLSAGSLYNLSNWHWVLIVGITIQDNNIIAHIFDEGRYKKIDFSLWLNSTSKNGGLITFSRI